ncbi:MAG: flagellar hook-associated protein 3 [Treponema sp.]|nr:flagellar hook-associated protein 3 [Treponema sp.]
MRRVSTDMPNNDIQYRLRRQEEGLAKVQAKIGEQKRIHELRDDPLAASNAVRYESYLARLKRFETNTLYARDHYRQQDIYIQQAVGVMQRIRELSVLGANGVNTREDMRNMAVEVNELLKELVAAGNAEGPDGKRLFSGDKALTEPFRPIEGMVQGGGESMVVRVEYRGSGPARRTETGDGVYAQLDIGGGEAFWAEKMQVFSTVDATTWRAAADGAFFIDGEEIPVRVGDTLPAVIARINESAAPVKASVDPQTRGLALEGTNPHLIRLEDRRGSRTLEELGLITGNAPAGAPNWSPQARVAGGSLFDMVIRLRDGLFRGDQDFVGSQGIGGIDLALTNLETRLTDIGSRYERAEMTWSRINEEIPHATAYLSREEGLNMADAATDLAMMDFAHRAALQTAAKIVPPTLLDFLR